MVNTETSEEAWRLLIVDASRSRFSRLMTALEEAKIGTEFVSATAKNLEERAVEIQPHIILVNLFLNGKSTLPMITRLKTLLASRGTRMIVITAHNSINNIRESVKAGANDFVLEPIDPQLMIQRIRYQLQERQAFNPEELNKPVAPLADGSGLHDSFQLVYESLRILSEVTDHHEALTTVLSAVAEHSSSNRVNLIEGDLETNIGLVAATSDDVNLKDKPIDLEKYPEVREVLLNSNIIYIKDISQNPLTKGIQEQVKSIKITSLLVFPIRHRNQTLGSLNVRLAGETSASETYLKTFYMIALALGPKLAARKLLRRRDAAAVKTSSANDPTSPKSDE